MKHDPMPGVIRATAVVDDLRKRFANGHDLGVGVDASTPTDDGSRFDVIKPTTDDRIGEVLDVVALKTDPAPPPERVIGPLVLSGEVTLFAAHGGTGKSFLALYMACCVALGRDVFGLPVRQGPVLYFSAEDPMPVLKHRLKWIADEMGFDLADLEGMLFVVDATEVDATLYRDTLDRRDSKLTRNFTRLRGFMRTHHVSLAFIDNASDVYAASEIDRSRVRAFMRALGLLARANDAGIMLLAHVDKRTARGDDTGESYSGSTAWHNAARVRLFMYRHEDGTLRLTHDKHTHTERLPEMVLRWEPDRLPELDRLTSPVTSEIDATRALLRLIDTYTARGEWVAAKNNSTENATRLLAEEPTYPKLEPRRVFQLLRNAEGRSHLVRVQYRDEWRRTRERWELTDAGRAWSSLFAASAASAASTENGTQRT